MPREWFWFASDWIRKWRECSGTIVDSSEVKPMQSRITLIYSLLEIVLEGKPWCFCLYVVGVYGHSAVHYSTSSKTIILVFGGYRFRIHSVAASDELYSFDLTSKKWSILQPMPSNEVRLVKSKLLCLLCEKKILDKSYSNEQSF